MTVRSLYPVEKQNMEMRNKIENEMTVRRHDGQIAAYEYISTHDRKKSTFETYQVNMMIIFCFIVYMGFLIL